MTEQQVRIFTSTDGQAQLEVALNQETAWLSLDQMTSLFERDKSVISRHIGNVFKDGELDWDSVVAKNATTAADGKTYQVDYYNLDVIISAGYRVKFQRGVQFRKWATAVLKEHLVQGYTLNQRRLTERGIEFEQAVNLLSRTLTNQGLVSTEGEAVARVISDYARSWSLLQGYDEQHLAEVGIKQPGMQSLELDEALRRFSVFVVSAPQRSFAGKAGRTTYQRQHPGGIGTSGCYNQETYKRIQREIKELPSSV